jgi:hypothetical protein
MAAPKPLYGLNFVYGLKKDNLKNGFYRLHPWPNQQGISAIVIVQKDNSIPITGTLVFSWGDESKLLDLAATGKRRIRLASLMPCIDVEIDVDPQSEFTIRLV